MSVCKRCGAVFGCAMVDGNDGGPCWCTALPPVVPVPAVSVPDASTPAVPLPLSGAGAAAGAAGTDATCWCPACLARHIAEKKRPPAPDTAPS